MATIKIRVIRSWDAEVDAEYGDTDEMLKAKVTEEYLDATAPDAETRAMLPRVMPVGANDPVVTKHTEEEIRNIRAAPDAFRHQPNCAQHIVEEEPEAKS